MLTQLDSAAIMSGVIWSALGMVIYFGYRKYRASRGEASQEPELNLDAVLEEPSAEEKARMDKEYRLWRTIVIIAAVAALGLYIFPYLAS